VLEDLRLDQTTEVTSEHHPELLGGVTLPQRQVEP